MRVSVGLWGMSWVGNAEGDRSVMAVGTSKER